MGARQLPVPSRGVQGSVHQGENTSLGASAEKQGNSIPVSSRKHLIGQYWVTCLLLINHCSLGDGVQPIRAQPCSQRSCQFPRKVVTVQGNSGYPNGNQGTVKRGKRMEVMLPTNSKCLFYSTNYLTNNCEIAGGGHTDWWNKGAKPTSIIIQNQQRMSEIYGSIDNSLNILFRHVEGASRKNNCKSYKSHYIWAVSLGMGWNRAGHYDFS